MAEIHFYCAICGKSLCAEPHSAGGFRECPRCLRVVPVPGFPLRPGGADCAPVFSPRILAIEIKFRCESCGSKIRVDARFQGQRLDCPVCRRMTQVPDWRGALPPEPALQKIPLDLLSLEEREFLTAPMATEAWALTTAQNR